MNKNSSDFTPHPWLASGHLQTVAAAYAGRSIPYRATETYVTLPDGDEIVLHEDVPPTNSAHPPVSILVHGLAGCHASPYMARLAAKLTAEGVVSVRMDQRGSGAGSERARQSNHGARSDDIGAVISQIRRRFPRSRVTLIGFSLGAAMSLRWATLTDEPESIDQLIAVAPPLDFTNCSNNLERGMNRFYSRYFARRLMKQVTSSPSLRSLLPRDVIESPPRSLAEFDRRITAPLGGFHSLEDYYQAASPLPRMKDIRVNTTIFAAKDDPLIPVADYARADFSSSTKVRLTDRGGHVGFLANPRTTTDPDWHWIDWRILALVLEQN